MRNNIKNETIRIREAALEAFAIEAFMRAGVQCSIAGLGVRSLLDASLMGIDSHGIESLDMYLTHIKKGGLDPNAEPRKEMGNESVELWDMQHGLGLCGARMVMEHAIHKAKLKGIHFITCRNANHLGACGVYAKMAADSEMIGIISQQTMASMSPCGAREPRIGTSPFAFAAPAENSFPFIFDAGMAAITRHKIKICREKGLPLPKGVALDAQGEPTDDPCKAWHGQLLPIGAHKGVGLAMVFEVLSSILSGGKLSNEIDSIVDNSHKSAGSGIFIIVIDPATISPISDFTKRMKEYIEYIESSTPYELSIMPRYPGRREGEIWQDRKQNGIPISADALQKYGEIAISLSVQSLSTSLN